MKRNIPRLLLPWILCVVFLAWGWGIRDPFKQLPAYGDALEVIWGIEWYHDALFVSHTSPLFDPRIFHPNGWHTATLAHTPAIFLLAQPFRLVGGPVFAYNALAFLSFIVAFWGCRRFFELYIPSPAILAVCAAAFTFMGFRWFRVDGHLHILWASSLLPWFLAELALMRRDVPFANATRRVIWAGLLWGLMICFSLYSVFLGALAFALWARQLFTVRRLKQAAAIGALAFAVGIPTVIVFLAGSRADSLARISGQELYSWGASLNSLAIPSVNHPLPAVRNLAHALYRGPDDESGWANLGCITMVLGLSGMVLSMRKGRENRHLVLLAALGLTLALGLNLRWNGRAVKVPVLKPVNQALWYAGHLLKPAVFDTETTPEALARGIPLPGYLFSVFVPFWDAGRVASRYAFVGGMGLIALAGIALLKIPKVYRYLLLAAWLAEALPAPKGKEALPVRGHPAYQWLASRPGVPGEGIVDISNPSIMMGSEIILATLYHGMPTASGTGSFWPEHVRALFDYFAEKGALLSQRQSSLVLQQYGVRYLLLHVKGDRDREMWAEIQKNPSLKSVQCFESQGNVLWYYPICIAEVLPDNQINMLTVDGWSEREHWGIAAEGEHPRADWYATKRQDHNLTMQAHPTCHPGAHQALTVALNGEAVFSHKWAGCEAFEKVIPLPRQYIRVGRNNVILHIRSSQPPADALDGAHAGDRDSGFRFSMLRIDSGRAGGISRSE